MSRTSDTGKDSVSTADSPRMPISEASAARTASANDPTSNLNSPEATAEASSPPADGNDDGSRYNLTLEGWMLTTGDITPEVWDVLTEVRDPALPSCPLGCWQDCPRDCPCECHRPRRGIGMRAGQINNLQLHGW